VSRALLGAAAALLVLPAAASAHVTVLPSSLTVGARTTLVFSAPNERPPHSLVAVTLTVPAGVALSPVSPPPGWKLDLRPGFAVWSGGRVGPAATFEFRVAATTRRAPGTIAVRVLQRYDDHRSVRWTVPLTVLPAAEAPKEHLWPALLAGAVGVVVIVGGLAFLRLRGRDADGARP